MQTLNCPHCHKPINFVGTYAEIEREYGLRSNTVTTWREKGIFPRPVIEYDKAHIYLVDDILRFKEQRLRHDIGPMVDKFERDLKSLPPEVQDEAWKLLEERLLNGDEPPKPTRKRTMRKRGSSSPRKGKGGLEGA